MQTDFKIRDRGPAMVMSRRTTVRLATIGTAISGGFAEIYGYLGPRGAASGAPFVVYHGIPGEGDRPFDIEVCAPVREPLDPPAGWQLTTLPAGVFASVLHLGPYDTLGTAYDELESWIANQGFAVAGPPREVYLSEPSTPPEGTRTVIEFPVVASTAAVPATVS